MLMSWLDHVQELNNVGTFQIYVVNMNSQFTNQTCKSDMGYVNQIILLFHCKW